MSYDHGDDSLRIPPSECSKIVTFNPTTNEYSFDINTARVVPRRRVAGYTSPNIVNGDINNGIVRENGFSTGTVTLDILDEMAVENDNKYLIMFNNVEAKIGYNVEDTKTILETFVSFYDNPVKLTYAHLNEDNAVVQSTNGSTTFEAGKDYELDAIGGTIVIFDPLTHPGASMDDETPYNIQYTYFPIFQSTKIDSELSNPIFDGLRLVVKQKAFGINSELTGWSTSSTTNMVNNLLDYKIVDPTDYEIRFTSQISDTAVNDVATNFSIWNVLLSEKVDYAVAENKVNMNWDPGDIIFILKGGVTFEDIAWEVHFDSTSTGFVKPTNGDVFYIGTDKPFSDGDVFSFQTESASVSSELAKSSMDDIAVVPNPYVATNVIEPRNTIEREKRGYRRMYFDNLPAKCTIRIYTMTGELVRVLEHDSALDDGQEYWDLLTKDNMEVAYGLYFYHVDAPDIGEKIGKFAIIK